MQNGVVMTDKQYLTTVIWQVLLTASTPFDGCFLIADKKQISCAFQGISIGNAII